MAGHHTEFVPGKLTRRLVWLLFCFIVLETLALIAIVAFASAGVQHVEIYAVAFAMFRLSKRLTSLTLRLAGTI